MKISSNRGKDLSKNLKIMDSRDSRITEDCKTGSFQGQLQKYSRRKYDCYHQMRKYFGTL